MLQWYADYMDNLERDGNMAHEEVWVVALKLMWFF